MEDNHRLDLLGYITTDPKVVSGQSSRDHDLEKILQDRRAKPCNIPFQYLKDITNDFSEEQELGRGAFGVVYKGELRNGLVVAVKKLMLRPGMHDKHFENEVYQLMRLKHENIVRIVGYCYEIQHILIEHLGKFCFAEMPQRLLCLELMPKGSLENHLSDESHGLDWHKRFKIIVGICRGLHYLHEEWQTGTPIIHLDLKPANIFLNDNMVPKIADFGLSRLFDPEQTRAYTRTLVGSLGYMAPEYLNKGIITIKADIFSLGVMLIKIITGHKNYPDGTETSTHFVEHVLNNWRNRFEELKHTSIEKDCKQIKTCIKIGLNCVQTDATKRPTTKEIIETLDRSDSTLLHVNNEEKSPADIDDKFWNKSDLTSDYRKELRICKRLKIHGNYMGPEEAKPYLKDKSSTEILEPAGTRDPQVEGLVALATAGDSLRGKLMYLENRVALARILFPTEVRIAMDIAELDGSLEFTLGANPPPELQRTTVTADINNIPFEFKEQHLARMRALSKTVELGKRFFPSCSKILDRVMDDETEYYLGRDTSIVETRRRFHDLQDRFQKAFIADRRACPSSSLSTTIGAV